MDSEVRKAFWIWKQICRLEERDLQIQQVLEVGAPEKVSSWLELCREGQWLTQEELAGRLGLQRSGFRKIEKKESEGKITIESLRKAAEAMDCELVYFVRPKSRKTFSVLLWDQVFPRALEIYKQRQRTDKVKPLILGKIASWLATHTKFRRDKGWAQLSRRFHI